MKDDDDDDDVLGKKERIQVALTAKGGKTLEFGLQKMLIEMRNV
jgi:hypothetical protein